MSHQRNAAIIDRLKPRVQLPSVRYLIGLLCSEDIRALMERRDVVKLGIVAKVATTLASYALEHMPDSPERDELLTELVRKLQDQSFPFFKR